MGQEHPPKGLVKQYKAEEGADKVGKRNYSEKIGKGNCSEDIKLYSCRELCRGS